ncbi:MAG TPA: peptidylprolyl isomerase [Nitrososphaerales archaeon]|nr:peptidylprolyl isomerase [Nitrososphaerales archaeon]
MGVLIVVVVVGIVGLYVLTRPKPCTTPDVIARINTTQGAMDVELFPCAAPKTVANFVSLVNSKFYDNLVWHRIVKGFIIQTGDPNTRNGAGNKSQWGSGGSGTTIPFESNDLPNDEGYLAMANTAPRGNGATSQFFINLANNTSLNGDYTVFGKVISNMSVAIAIGNLPVTPSCQSSGELQCPPVDPSEAMVVSITIISDG